MIHVKISKMWQDTGFVKSKIRGDSVCKAEEQFMRWIAGFYLSCPSSPVNCHNTWARALRQFFILDTKVGENKHAQVFKWLLATKSGSMTWTTIVRGTQMKQPWQFMFHELFRQLKIKGNAQVRLVLTSVFISRLEHTLGLEP